MDTFLGHLKDLVNKCRADPNPKPEDCQDRDRMMQLAIEYDRDQVKKAQGQQALDLRKAGQELKVRRLALLERREKERARERKKAAARDGPRDFDNTERIARAREAHFADVNTPENIARVDAKLAKAYADAGIDPHNNPNLIHPG